MTKAKLTELSKATLNKLQVTSAERRGECKATFGPLGHLWPFQPPWVHSVIDSHPMHANYVQARARVWGIHVSSCRPHAWGDMYTSYLHGRYVHLIHAQGTCLPHTCMGNIQRTRFFKNEFRTPTYKTYSKKKRKFLEMKEGPWVSKNSELWEADICQVNPVRRSCCAGSSGVTSRLKKIQSCLRVLVCVLLVKGRMAPLAICILAIGKNEGRRVSLPRAMTLPLTLSCST